MVYSKDSTAGERPLALRLVWPWIEALAVICRPLISWHLRSKLQRLLERAGVQADWTPQHLCALQCLIALVVGVLTALMATAIFSLSTSMAVSLMMGIICANWPVQRLRDAVKRRKRAIARDFPFLLDMVTLCVEAGLNLHGALQQAALHGPHGPLRDELRHTLADIRAGAARHDALRDWARRCDLPAVQLFVAAIAQADQFGMSLGPVLRAQADQRRNERYLRAEKLAQEAPVKMMFPLIFCVFLAPF